MDGRQDAVKGTGIVYDERMTLHASPNHPESPERITAIWKRLEEAGLVKRCTRVEARKATEEELSLVHTEDVVDTIKKSGSERPAQYWALHSIYFNESTYESASVAAGSVINLTASVCAGKLRNGLAVTRPPGHHAESEHPDGFCFFNNIALAAKTALATADGSVKKVLIVDWDVHHGNGVQNCFYEDPNVLYFSVHRYDNGTFYPGTPKANYDMVGTKKGTGYNINVAWNSRGMGDADYLAVFHQILMPVAYEFNPDLVLVSCGLDSALGDSLGMCCVTPEGYAHMTQLLCGLAGGRVVLALEGGYNLTSISKSMVAICSVLLGDPPQRLQGDVVPSADALKSIGETQSVLACHWKCLKHHLSPENEPNTSIPAVDKDEQSSATEPRPQDQVEPRPQETAKPSALVVNKGEQSSALEPKEQAESRPQDQVEACPQETAKLSAPVVNKGEQAEPRPQDQVEPRPPDTGDDMTDMLSQLELEGHSRVFAVQPKHDCPHLGRVKPLPSDGRLDAKQPCGECENTAENWVCLECYQVYCGRYVMEHMVQHTQQTGHAMVLSYADLSVWCYPCDSYVHNPTVFPAIDSAHVSKFGRHAHLSM